MLTDSAVERYDTHMRWKADVRPLNLLDGMAVCSLAAHDAGFKSSWCHYIIFPAIFERIRVSDARVLTLI